MAKHRYHRRNAATYNVLVWITREAEYPCQQKCCRGSAEPKKPMA